ncbi:hypothetical protein SVIOM342S_07394 [Streptomyces violaceorubidus]
MTTAVAAPFRFFSLRVVRTRRLGPSLARVTFAGPDLRAFHSDGLDQSLSLFLPHPGQAEPAVPVELGDGWWQGWRELPDDVRAVMRSYTLRALRRDADGHTAEIDVDFVLHGVGPAGTGTDGEPGPAARWAADAAPGDRVLLLGPAVADNRAIRFRPPEDTDLVVIWGDATAVPAACAIVEALPRRHPRPGLAGGAARRGRAGPGDGRGRRGHLAGQGRRRRPRGDPRRSPRGPAPARRPPLRLDRGRVRVRQGAAAALRG